MASNFNRIIIDAEVKGKLTNAREIQAQTEAMNEAHQVGDRLQSRQVTQEMRQLQALIQQAQKGENKNWAKIKDKDRHVVDEIQSKIDELHATGAQGIQDLARQVTDAEGILGKRATKALREQIEKIQANLTIDDIAVDKSAIDRAKQKVRAGMGTTRIDAKVAVDTTEIDAAETRLEGLQAQAIATERGAQRAQRRAERVKREAADQAASEARAKEQREERMVTVVKGERLLEGRKGGILGDTIAARRIIEQEDKSGKPYYTDRQKAIAFNAVHNGVPENDPFLRQRTYQRFRDAASDSSFVFEWPEEIEAREAREDRVAQAQARVAQENTKRQTVSAATRHADQKRRQQARINDGLTPEQARAAEEARRESGIAQRIRDWKQGDQPISLSELPKSSQMHPSSWGIGDDGKLNAKGTREVYRSAARAVARGYDAAPRMGRQTNNPTQLLRWRNQQRSQFFGALEDPTGVIEALTNTAAKQTDARSMYFGEDVRKALGLQINYGHEGKTYKVHRGSELEKVLDKLHEGAADLEKRTGAKQTGLPLRGASGQYELVGHNGGQSHDIDRLFGFFNGSDGRTPGELLRLLYGGDTTTGYTEDGEAIRKFVPGGLAGHEFVPYASRNEHAFLSDEGKNLGLRELTQGAESVRFLGKFERSDEELAQLMHDKQVEARRDASLGEMLERRSAVARQIDERAAAAGIDWNDRAEWLQNSSIREELYKSIRETPGLDDVIDLNFDAKQADAELKEMLGSSLPLRRRDRTTLPLSNLEQSMTQDPGTIEALDGSSRERAEKYLALKDLAVGQKTDRVRDHFAQLMYEDAVGAALRPSVDEPSISELAAYKPPVKVAPIITDTLPAPLRPAVNSVVDMVDEVYGILNRMDLVHDPKDTAEDSLRKREARKAVLDDVLPGLLARHRATLETSMTTETGRANLADLIDDDDAGKDEEFERAGLAVRGGRPTLSEAISTQEYLNRYLNLAKITTHVSSALGLDNKRIADSAPWVLASKQHDPVADRAFVELKAAWNNPGRFPRRDALLAQEAWATKVDRPRAIDPVSAAWIDRDIEEESDPEKIAERIIRDQHKSATFADEDFVQVRGLNVNADGGHDPRNDAAARKSNDRNLYDRGDVRIARQMLDSDEAGDLESLFIGAPVSEAIDPDKEFAGDSTQIVGSERFLQDIRRRFGKDAYKIADENMHKRPEEVKKLIDELSATYRKGPKANRKAGDQIEGLKAVYDYLRGGAWRADTVGQLRDLNHPEEKYGDGGQKAYLKEELGAKTFSEVLEREIAERIARGEKIPESERGRTTKRKWMGEGYDTWRQGAAEAMRYRPGEWRGGYDLVPTGPVAEIPSVSSQRDDRNRRLRQRAKRKANGKIYGPTRKNPIALGWSELPEVTPSMDMVLATQRYTQEQVVAEIVRRGLLSPASKAPQTSTAIQRYQPVGPSRRQRALELAKGVAFGPGAQPITASYTAQVQAHQPIDINFDVDIKDAAEKVRPHQDKDRAVVDPASMNATADHTVLEGGHQAGMIGSNLNGKIDPAVDRQLDELTVKTAEAVQEMVDQVVPKHKQIKVTDDDAVEPDWEDGSKQRHEARKTGQPVPEPMGHDNTFYTPTQPLASGNPWIDQKEWENRDQSEPINDFVETEYGKAFNSQVNHDARRAATGGEALAENLNLSDYYQAKAAGTITSSRQARQVDATHIQRNLEEAQEFLAGLMGMDTQRLRTSTNSRGMTYEGAFRAIGGGTTQGIVNSYSDAALREMADYAKLMVDTPQQARQILLEARQKLRSYDIRDMGDQPDVVGLTRDQVNSSKMFGGQQVSSSELRQWMGTQANLDRRGVAETLASRVGMDYAGFTDASKGRSFQSLMEDVSGLSSKKLFDMDAENLTSVAEATRQAYESMRQFGVESTDFKGKMDAARDAARQAIINDQTIKGTTTEGQDRARRYKAELDSWLAPNADGTDNNRVERWRRDAKREGIAGQLAQDTYIRNRAADHMNRMNEAKGMLKAGAVNMGAFLGGSLLEQGLTTVATQVQDGLQAQRSIQRIFEIQNSGGKSTDKARDQSASAWAAVNQYSGKLGATQTETAQVVGRLSDGGTHSLKEVKEDLASLARAAQNTGATLKDIVAVMDSMEAINIDPADAADFLGQFAGLKDLALEDIQGAATKIAGNQQARFMSTQEKEQLILGLAGDKKFAGFSSDAYVAAQQTEKYRQQGDKIDNMKAPELKKGGGVMEWVASLLDAAKLSERLKTLINEAAQAFGPVVAGAMAVLNVILDVVNATLHWYNKLGAFKNVIGVLAGIAAAIYGIGVAIQTTQAKAAGSFLMGGLSKVGATLFPTLARIGAGWASAGAAAAAAGTAGAGAMASMTTGATALAGVLLPLAPLLLAAGVAAVAVGSATKKYDAETAKNEKLSEGYDAERETRTFASKIKTYDIGGSIGDQIKDIKNGENIFKETDADRAMKIARVLSGEFPDALALAGMSVEDLQQKIDAMANSGDERTKRFVDQIKNATVELAGVQHATKGAAIDAQGASEAYVATERRKRSGSYSAFRDALTGQYTARLEEDIDVGAARTARDEYEKSLKKNLNGVGIKDVEELAVKQPGEYIRVQEERRKLGNNIVDAELRSIEAHKQILVMQGKLRDNKADQLEGERQGNQEAQNKLRIMIDEEQIAEAQGKGVGNLHQLNQEMNKLILERKQIEDSILQNRIEQLQYAQKAIDLEKDLAGKRAQTGEAYSLAAQEAGTQAARGSARPAGALFDRVLADLRDPNQKDVSAGKADAAKLLALMPSVQKLDALKQGQQQELDTAKLDLQSGNISNATYQKRVQEINARAAREIEAAQVNFLKASNAIAPLSNRGEGMLAGLQAQYGDRNFRTSTGFKDARAAQLGAYEEDRRRVQAQRASADAQLRAEQAQAMSREGWGAADRFAARQVGLDSGYARETLQLKTVLSRAISDIDAELKKPGLNSADRQNLETRRREVQSEYNQGTISARSRYRQETFGNRIDNWLENAQDVPKDKGKETPDVLRKKLAVLDEAIRKASMVDPKFGTSIKQSDITGFERLVDARKGIAGELAGKLDQGRKAQRDFQRQINSLYGDVTDTVTGNENRGVNILEAVRDSDVLTADQKRRLGLGSDGRAIKGSKLAKSITLAGRQDDLKRQADQFTQDRKLAELKNGKQEYKFDREGFADRARAEYEKASKAFNGLRGNFPDMASFERAKSAALAGLLENVRTSEKAVDDWKREMANIRAGLRKDRAGLMGSDYSTTGQDLQQKYLTLIEEGKLDPNSAEAKQAKANADEALLQERLNNQASGLKSTFEGEDAYKRNRKYDINYRRRADLAEEAYRKQLQEFDDTHLPEVQSGKLSRSDYERLRASATKAARELAESTDRQADEIEKNIRSLEDAASKLGERFGFAVESHAIETEIDEVRKRIKESGQFKPGHPIFDMLQTYKEAAEAFDRMNNELSKKTAQFELDDAQNILTPWNINRDERVKNAQADYDLQDSLFEMEADEKGWKGDQRTRLKAQWLKPWAGRLKSETDGKISWDNGQFQIDEMVRTSRESLGLSGELYGNRENDIRQKLRDLDGNPNIDKTDARYGELQDMLPQAQKLDSADRALKEAQYQATLSEITNSGGAFDVNVRSLEEYKSKLGEAGKNNEALKDKINDMTASLIRQGQAATIAGKQIRDAMIAQDRTNTNLQKRLTVGVGNRDRNATFLADQNFNVQQAEDALSNFRDSRETRRVQFLQQNIDPAEMIRLLGTDKLADDLRAEMKVDPKTGTRSLDPNSNTRALAMGKLFDNKDALEQTGLEQNVTQSKQQRAESIIDRLSGLGGDTGDLGFLSSALFNPENKRSVDDLIGDELAGTASLVAAAKANPLIKGTVMGDRAIADAERYQAKLTGMTDGQKQAFETVRTESGKQVDLQRRLQDITGIGPSFDAARIDLQQQISASNARMSLAADTLSGLLPKSVLDGLKKGGSEAEQLARRISEENFSKASAVSQAKQDEARQSYERTMRHAGDLNSVNTYYQTLADEKGKQFTALVDGARTTTLSGLLAKYQVSDEKALRQKAAGMTGEAKINIDRELKAFDSMPTALSAASMTVEELEKVVGIDLLNAIIKVRGEVKALDDESAQGRAAAANRLGEQGRALRDAVQGSFQDHLNRAIGTRDWEGAGRAGAMLVSDKKAGLAAEYNAFYKTALTPDQVMSTVAKTRDGMFISQLADVVQTQRTVAEQIKTAAWESSYTDSLSKFDRDVERNRPRISERAGDRYDLAMLQKKLAFQQSQNTSGMTGDAAAKVAADIRNTITQIETVTNRMQDRWKDFWTGMAKDMMGILKDGLTKVISRELDRIFGIEDERTRQYRKDTAAVGINRDGALAEADQAQQNADIYQRNADQAKSAQDRQHWLNLRDRALDDRDNARRRADASTTQQQILDSNKAIDDQAPDDILIGAVNAMKDAFISRFSGELLDQTLGSLLDDLLGKISGAQDPQIAATTALSEASAGMATSVTTFQETVTTALSSAGTTYVQAANTMMQAAVIMMQSAGSKGGGDGSGGAPSSGGSASNTDAGGSTGGTSAGNAQGTTPSTTPTKAPDASKSTTTKPVDKYANLSHTPLISNPLGQKVATTGIALASGAMKPDTGSALLDYGANFVKSGLTSAAVGLVTGGTAGMASALASAFGPIGLAVGALGAGIMVLNKEISSRKRAQAWEADNRYGAVSSVGIHTYGLPKNKWVQVGGSTDKIDVQQVNVTLQDPLSSPRGQMEIGRQLTRAASVEALRKGVNG